MRTGLAILPVFAAPLMLQGRAFGLAPVPVASRGGAFVARLLAVFSIGPAIPLARPLAVARHATTSLLRIPVTLVVEAIRGVPGGRAEGAASLVLTHWQGLRLVVWPQGSTHRLPPTVGTIIGAAKDTSLVLVIGVFDDRRPKQRRSRSQARQNRRSFT